MSKQENKEVRKKPVKGFLVPSRYKEAAEGFSKQSSHSKDSTRSSETTLLSSTAVKDRVALPPIDASVIKYNNSSRFTANRSKPTSSSAEWSMLAAPKMKKDPKLVGTNHAGTKQKIKSSQKKNQTLEDKEKEIDLLYVEYLQAKLLESNAKIALQRRSENALQKIHDLWTLMEELLGKNAVVKRDLDFADYLVNLNEHLTTQEKLLLPALEVISVLEKSYEEIATSVYSVRHKLGTKNVKWEPGSEGEIIELLDKIKSLLDTIMSCVQSCDEVISNAEVCDTLSKRGKFVTENLERGYQLVAEATDLLLTESSLLCSD